MLTAVPRSCVSEAGPPSSCGHPRRADRRRRLSSFEVDAYASVRIDACASIGDLIPTLQLDAQASLD